MSIAKLVWTWRQPAIPEGSAEAERMRGRIIVGMLTGRDAAEKAQAPGSGDDPKK